MNEPQQFPGAGPAAPHAHQHHPNCVHAAAAAAGPMSGYGPPPPWQGAPVAPFTPMAPMGYAPPPAPGYGMPPQGYQQPAPPMGQMGGMPPYYNPYMAPPPAPYMPPPPDWGQGAWGPPPWQQPAPAPAPAALGQAQTGGWWGVLGLIGLGMAITVLWLAPPKKKDLVTA